MTELFVYWDYVTPMNLDVILWLPATQLISQLQKSLLLQVTHEEQLSKVQVSHNLSFVCRDFTSHSLFALWLLFLGIISPLLQRCLVRYDAHWEWGSLNYKMDMGWMFMFKMEKSPLH